MKSVRIEFVAPPMAWRTSLTLFAFCSLTGCGGHAPDPSEGSVRIQADDQMRFSKRSLSVKAGESLTIELVNVGKAPKEIMGHNLVILKPGTKTRDFGLAAVDAKSNDYIPAAMQDRVVAHTPLLGPGESAKIEFSVTTPGTYPFLCSFPGHAATMTGQIRVTR